MKIITISFLLLLTSCSDGDPGDKVAISRYFTIINQTQMPLFIGSLEHGSALALYNTEPGFTNTVQAMDYDAEDYYTDLYTGKQVVLVFRRLGLCIFHGGLTNDTSEYLRTLDDNDKWFLTTAADPTNQYLPPSMIYRMAITTNEIVSNGKYAWEVPTNTRPFYIILTNNPVIVITSVMTNITN